jgi:hypothetical protein
MRVDIEVFQVLGALIWKPDGVSESAQFWGMLASEDRTALRWNFTFG